MRNAANVLALRARECRGGGAFRSEARNEAERRNPEKPGLPLGRSARIIKFYSKRKK